MKNTPGQLKAKPPSNRGFAEQKQHYVDAIVAETNPCFNYEGDL